MVSIRKSSPSSTANLPISPYSSWLSSTHGNFAATLFQNLDHAPGSNTLAINLTARVYDGDLDYVDRAFTVNVTDTVPELVGQSDTGTLVEGKLPYVSSTFGNLHVDLNADDKNTHVEIAKDGNGHYILPQGLTSDGVALDYIVRTTNGVDQEIVAFKHGETADQPVFIVGVLHPGSFVATLYQNLDHAPGSDTLAINLTARVYDGDGDYVDRPFVVNVTDDVPTLSAPSAVIFNLLTNGDFADGAWDWCRLGRWLCERSRRLEDHRHRARAGQCAAGICPGRLF